MLYPSKNRSTVYYLWPRDSFGPGRISLLGGTKGGYEDFRTALGDRESSGSYTIVNPYGYMGRYQFGAARLNELQGKYSSLPHWGPRQNFLNNPSLQDQYFDTHVQDLARQMAPSLAEGQARYPYLTISGLIAAAHLKGPGGARRFVRGDDNADANGTRTSDYAQQFSGYDIPGFDEGSGEAGGDPGGAVAENGTTEYNPGAYGATISTGQAITAISFVLLALKFL